MKRVHITDGIQLEGPGIDRPLDSHTWVQYDLDIAERAANLAKSTDSLTCVSDVPALIMALRKPIKQGGLGLNDRKWLGITFHNCFRGQELIAWLLKRTTADQTTLLSFGEKLRQAGFFRHTIKSKSFNLTCLFFWASDEECRRLCYQEETIRNLKGDLMTVE